MSNHIEKSLNRFQKEEEENSKSLNKDFLVTRRSYGEMCCSKFGRICLTIQESAVSLSSFN